VADTRISPGPAVDGDPGHVAARHLALAGVQPGPHLEAEAPHPVADGPGALHRPPGGVEGGQEPVAGGLDLPALEDVELHAHEGVVLVEQLPPAGVPELRRPLRRPDDVGEENRGQPPFRLGPPLSLREEE